MTNFENLKNMSLQKMAEYCIYEYLEIKPKYGGFVVYIVYITSDGSIFENKADALKNEFDWLQKNI